MLLCECVDSRTGLDYNDSFVLHDCSWGQRYHMTRFSRWPTTPSVIQIPAGNNVQMKARLILLRKLKLLGANLTTPEKA